MILDLNEKHEYVEIDGQKFPFFKNFRGKWTEQVPEILGAGRIIIPTEIT